MDFTKLFTGNNNSKNKNNETKHHYFIGAVIDNEILVEKIKLIRRKLINYYSIKDLHYPNIISTNLIYLGYFNITIAKLYMDKILSYLSNSVVGKYPKLECKMTNFKMTYDQSYYRIMLQLEDNNSHLKKVIIPYLHKNGIEKIYGEKKNEKKASIDILYFKESKKIENLKKKYGRKFRITLDYPIDIFVLNKLALIQGTPVVTRSGTPSTHDNLDFKVIKEYEYEFKGTNNQTSNQSNNINSGNKNENNNNVNKRNNNNVNKRNNNNVNKRNNNNSNNNNRNNNGNNNGNNNRNNNI